MKEITKALIAGKLERNFFIESPLFAFENPPRTYRDYLERSIEYAEKYGLDAIPISQKFNNKTVNRDIMLEILSHRETPVGLGITYSAPFTRTAREIGLTNFLLLNINKVMSVFKQCTYIACVRCNFLKFSQIFISYLIK